MANSTLSSAELIRKTAQLERLMNLENEIKLIREKDNPMDDSLDISLAHDNIPDKKTIQSRGNPQDRETQKEFSKDDIIQIYDNKGEVKEINSLLRIKEETIKIYSRREWIKILDINDLQNTPNFEIYSSLRQGVPEDLRPRIWFYLASVENYEKIHNEDLYSKLKSTPSTWDDDIEKDIPRTSQLEYFEANGMGRVMLFNILRAYSNYDVEVGYTQGMNFVVANILLALDPNRYSDKKDSFGKSSYQHEDQEKKGFWIFTFINYQKNWREVYKKGTPKVKSLVKHLKTRVSREIPEVFNHIQKFEDVTIDLCFFQSFVTIVMYFTPPELSIRILDLFLFKGESVLFDILTRMLNLCRKEILTLNTQEDLFKFMHKDIVKYCYENFLEVKTLVPLPQAEMIENVVKD